MDKIRFIREYTTEYKQANVALINNSTENLPYTFAYPISKLYKEIECNNYGKGMNYALDFFEISVQYLSCVLLVQIQEREKHLPLEKRAALKIINKIDTKRPLSFGDWVNDIFAPIVTIATAVLPDNELAKSIKRNLIEGKKNILSGTKKDPSIVKIRNDYRGHSTTLSEDIYKGVIYTIEPLILSMLRAMEPLQGYVPFSCSDSYKISHHKGCGTREQIVEQQFEKHHYYLRIDADSAPIDLFPFIFCNHSGYVYVFQTLKDESVGYISSNENAITFIDDCWNDDFDHRMQVTNPKFDIAKEFNWDELKDLMQAETGNFLGRAYKDKKYNQELFVDRKHLSELLDEFSQSDKTLFPLLGEAGQGKTNQLCYWGEKISKSYDGVLLLGGADFSAHTLETKIRKIFSVKGRDMHKFIDGLHNRAKERNRFIYIFFDAINECLTYPEQDTTQGPVALFNAIRELLGKQHYTHFKILFTCRSYTWKTLFSHHIANISHLLFGADHQDEATVRGFNDDELRQAYHIYGELYQMETLHAQLTRAVMIRLKDPLMLKIACTNYLCQPMPTEVSSYTSIKLFEEMMAKIANSYAGRSQCRIIKYLARYILEEYEHNRPTDHISAQLVRDAYSDEGSSLYHLSRLMYKSDGSTVAYNELLNKPERPVLRLAESTDNGSKQEIQFIYERFLEYALALVFVERDGELSAQIFVEQLHRVNSNVVVMGAMRNALIMNLMQTGSMSTIITLVRDYGDDSEVSLLINEVFNVLIRENYEQTLFSLISRLLDEQIPRGREIIEEFNEVTRKIAANKAESSTIARHKELNAQLTPIIRLRKLALISTLNGLFLTDFFNEELYKHSPYKLLWRLMTDPITEIANDSCLYAYYLSNKTHTLEYSPLKENLSERITAYMYSIIRSRRLYKLYLHKDTRTEGLIFLETATRIITLLILDTLLSEKEGSHERAMELLDEFKKVIKHITANYRVIKLLMPIFHFILRKQLTFQSEYVNNTIEYQTFWENSTFDGQVSKDWNKESLVEISRFIHHNHKVRNKLCEPLSDDFAKMHDKILSAYKICDGFSFLIIERILVIMGVAHWDNISPIVNGFFTDEYRKGEWFDYAQMSMLYVLFQTQVNSDSHNPELVRIFERECTDWTLRNRGLFKARNSHKASTTKGLYKRNVMNWYCVVYCAHIEDGIPYSGDERCAPLFYKLIDKAIEDNDRELLIHLIENISELISDFGYIKTALGLLHYTMSKLDSKKAVDKIDSVSLEREGIYSQDLVKLIGNVLSTAKHYSNSEVNAFLKRDMTTLSFPGASKYRDEILNYNPSGESLSDLLTHRFGNFLMWALLNMEIVDDFATEAVSMSVSSKSSVHWFDSVIKILFRDMFNVKL